MLTIEALRALYVKMGGNAADVADLELTPDIIEAIKTLYTSGLPAVTSEDNGLGLIVSNGAWNKGALPIGLPEVSDGDNGKSAFIASGAWTKGFLPTRTVFSYEYDAEDEAYHCTNGSLHDVVEALFKGLNVFLAVAIPDVGTFNAPVATAHYNQTSGVGFVTACLIGYLNETVIYSQLDHYCNDGENEGVNLTQIPLQPLSAGD